MKSVENSGTLVHALDRPFHAVDRSFHGLSTVCPRVVHGLFTVRSETVQKLCIIISRSKIFC